MEQKQNTIIRTHTRHKPQPNGTTYKGSIDAAMTSLRRNKLIPDKSLPRSSQSVRKEMTYRCSFEKGNRKPSNGSFVRSRQLGALSYCDCSDNTEAVAFLNVSEEMIGKFEKKGFNMSLIYYIGIDYNLNQIVIIIRK